MASILHTNNTLDTYPFPHTSFFRRSSTTKNLAAAETGLHAFGLDGVSNIWQTKTNPPRQYVAPSAATRRSDQPSLTLTAGRLDTHTLQPTDKWLSAALDAPQHHRPINSAAVLGRARLNESALLTPVSLSSADQSPSEAVHFTQDARSVSPTDGRTVLQYPNRWLSAPEFQPSRDVAVSSTTTPLDRRQSARANPRESNRKAPPGDENSEFRPVLPVACANTPSLTHDHAGSRGSAPLVHGPFNTNRPHDRKLGIGPSAFDLREHQSYELSGPAVGLSQRNSERGARAIAMQHYNGHTGKSSEYQGAPQVATGQASCAPLKTTYRCTPPDSYGSQHVWQNYGSIYGSGHSLDYYASPYAAEGQYHSTQFPNSSANRHDDERYVKHEAAPQYPGHTTRSPLLEDFRQNYKTRQYELGDIYGHIVEFSGDPHGSRLIQQQLEVATGEEKEQVFREVIGEARQLMTDLFGNYVIQKMFEHGSQSQKKALANTMKGHVLALSTQMYGCRVVQKALEHVLTEQQASLVRELDGHVLRAVEDQNGNHVIQRAIEFVPGEHIQFIVDTHLEHMHYLSKHAYGCRVIQRLLEYCRPEPKRAVLNQLHGHIDDLIVDAFGNYVVQHIIVKGEVQDRRCVVERITSRLVENSMHKFASNVVEKALDYADDAQRRVMLSKLTAVDENGHSHVLTLLMHQYGNYVIQKCAKHLQGHALQAVLEEMEKYHVQLRKVSNGKQVAALESSCREARMRLEAQRRRDTAPSLAVGSYRSFVRPRFS